MEHGPNTRYPTILRRAGSAGECLPRIVAVGLRQIKTVLQELAPRYVTSASVEVLDKGYEEAVSHIRQRQRAHGVDVIVAAGSNGAYLRQHLDVPVILVKVGGFDVMGALGRARSISPRLALVTYGEVAPELELFDQQFGLGVVRRNYINEDEARACVLALQAQGIEVVAAPGLVCDLAQEAGMKAVFLYSPGAVRSALDDAIEVARVSRIELAKRERLNTILGQLKDGVVAVDMDERIETLNPAMEQLLGASAYELSGRRLGDVAPELTLRPTLRHSRTELEEIQRFGGRTLVTSRMPIVEQGVQTGAVLTCQDPAAIQRVDRHLRTRRRMPSATVRYQLADLTGESAAMRRVRSLGGLCAGSDATVLVIGESGTGKELLAQGIHTASRRRRQPFVAVNCAAFSEALLESELFGYEEGAFTGSRRGGKLGLFEAAHTGTLFLDEVGEMPVSLQTRLLRVLQEREVLRIGATEATPIDVRVIAATHRDLAERIGAGAFRADLYYRLNILRIDLPALRDRPGDLEALAGQLLAKSLARLHLPHEPAGTLVSDLVRRGRCYPWPGNVRELENVIERIAAYSCGTDFSRADDVLPKLVPEIFGTSPTVATSLGDTTRDSELQAIVHTLRECGGDRGLACQRLGIGRTTLWRKLRQLQAHAREGATDGPLDGGGTRGTSRA
jgi:propionate catabolism operon transcriptional regulator